MKYKLTCEECKQDFFHSHSATKTCGEECRKKRYMRIWGRYGDTSIPSGTVGAISEMEVSSDLMSRGFAVFRALSPSCFCDVIAIKGDKILKVEIRTGYSASNGKVSFPTKTHGVIDIYGIYDRANKQCHYYDSKLNKISIY